MAERRNPDDRRSTDRRSGERRSGAPRRRGRRRRETPTPYNSEQMAQLRARFAAPGPALCPACGSRFSLGPGRLRGTDTARRVVCMGCGRAAIVPNSKAARVLVVGNRNPIRDVLQMMLGEAGHEVIEAADGAVALEAYHAVPADVVILDVLDTGRLPGMEFMRRLKRRFPEARAVALAGRPSFAGGDSLALTQGLGAARTIRVPFTRDELLKVVDDVRM